MIQIIDKHNCCGCSSCAQKCPKQCISMLEDEEGFLYPVVSSERCIRCYRCLSVCDFKSSQKARGYLSE